MSPTKKAPAQRHEPVKLPQRKADNGAQLEKLLADYGKADREIATALVGLANEGITARDRETYTASLDAARERQTEILGRLSLKA